MALSHLKAIRAGETHLDPVGTVYRERVGEEGPRGSPEGLGMAIAGRLEEDARSGDQNSSSTRSTPGRGRIQGGGESGRHELGAGSNTGHGR